MNFCKSLCILLFFVLFCFGVIGNVFSQERERIVKIKPNNQSDNQITNPPEKTQARTLHRQIPTSANKLIIVQNQLPLVKKIVSSRPINVIPNQSISKYFYSAVFSQRLLQAIQARVGTPYRYGSTGPNSYDCSGLVWSVFHDAGFYYERSSARNLWQNSEAVGGDDRYRFGTLVFFNGLGHIGIVVDDKGFYHASTSKGVTYSTFDGYWGKRIVGFRRLSLAKN
ncbi:MAG: C40 family peptidase [Acidobacteria bacterium]|nr:C40 family peptidase [Acidobacteriota bacterium]MCA1638190.1 C40 family peptidase [Acidobacteriota bacterium]